MATADTKKPGKGVVASWLYTLTSFVLMFGICALAILTHSYAIGLDAWVNVAIIAVLIGLLFGIGLLRNGLHSGPEGPVIQKAGLGIAIAVSLVLAGYAFFVRPDFSTGTLPLLTSLALLACILPKRWSYTLIAAANAVTLLHVAVSSPAESVWVIFFAVFITFTLYISTWAWDIVRKLDDARRTEADLAKTQERLRFASELHDVQGHTLQVLALKTELAERLLDSDLEAAREQLVDARTLAADALAQTRSIARGYQQVTLEQELDNVVDVLSAAGTECTLNIHETPQTDQANALVGRFVREATTNLLRHAPNASRASLELTSEDRHFLVRMTNDGAVPVGADGDATETALHRTPSGSGVSGLRAAFREAGGEVTEGIEDGEFTLTGKLPQ
ncbi:MAG: sensor histidine kinase [Gulosibacter sp.]|uniref:sensor histidine kinase n=1 Tax=Gulosibacter sp. TaxID=2817531 RepID=UPI003F925F54